MSRRGWIVVGLCAALVIAPGAAAVLFWQHNVPRQLATATSPDKSWTVTVQARPLLSGPYEIVVLVLDAQGQQKTAFVVGQTRDLAAAEKEFPVRFMDDKQAKVGNRTLERSQYFHH